MTKMFAVLILLSLFQVAQTQRAIRWGKRLCDQVR